ncbi:MAG: SusC/RagA family TonB-linked outer membrane protein [Bacteroidota bacterium]
MASFDQVLQGQTPGLLMRASSGQPGNSGSAIIRGRGSIQGSVEPIYIVDGIQIAATDFALINPNDIENVTVLKDAVASSLYGSRGGNGVIVVSTKKGAKGKPRFEIDAYTGWSTFPNFRDFRVMNTSEKIDYELRRGGTSLETYSPEEIDSLRKINTNWQDVLTRTGRTYSLNASAAGGSDKSKYYASVNYFKQEGTVRNTGFDRVTGRLNVSEDAGNFVFGINTTGTYSEISNTLEGDAFIGNPLNALVWTNPYEQEFVPGSYNAAGNFVSGGNALTRPNLTETGQPIASTMLFWNKNLSRQIRIVASGNAEYKIPFIKGLSLKTVYGIDYNSDEATNFTDRRTYLANPNPRPSGVRSNGSTRNNVKTWRNTLTNSINYAKSFKDHTIDVGAYYETLDLTTELNGYTSYSVDAPFQNEFGSVISANFLPRIRFDGGESKLESYFALLNYGFKNKYFLNANFRRDGSSRFGENNRYANFGGAGVSWIISEENFMKGLQSSFLNYLKLKASYGTVGSQEGIGLYASQGIVGPRLYNSAAGLQQTSLDLPNLQWEERRKINAGIEFGLFKGRINGGIEIYNELTDNLFFPRQLSRSTGFASITSNVGSVSNKGVEINISADVVKTRNWKVNISGNFTYNKNRVVKLDIRDTVVSGSNVLAKNFPLNSFYLVPYAGVNPDNGEALYTTLDGSSTETFSVNDRRIMGTSDPNTFGGFGFTVDYRAFSLSAQFTYMLNSFIYNAERYNLEVPDYYYDNVSVDLLNEWQNPGDITNIPSPNSLIQSETNRFLEDNSFVRLRNLSLSYSLPKKVADVLKLRGAMFYVNGTNLWVSTKYRGRDPETNGNVTISQYPALRTVQVGCRVTF